MPLPFILGGIALTVAGYGVKKGLMQRILTTKPRPIQKS